MYEYANHKERSYVLIHGFCSLMAKATGKRDRTPSAEIARIEMESHECRGIPLWVT